jgi:hypothetical protein
MARKIRNATQDANGLWWSQATDEDGNPVGERFRVKQVIGEDDDGNQAVSYTRMSPAEIVRAEQGGRFTSQDSLPMDDEGNFIWAGGDTIPYEMWLQNVWANDPASYGGNAKDVAPLFGGRMPSPEEFLSSQYSPWVQNADGTVSYSTTKPVSSIYYNGNEPSLFHKIMPAVMGGMFTAGLGGLLPGTTSVFGSGAAGGVNAINSFDSGAMASILGTDAAAAGGAGAFSMNLPMEGGFNAFEGAVDGINWGSDIFDPNALSTFTGDASAGWDVASLAGNDSFWGSALKGISSLATPNNLLSAGANIVSGLLGSNATRDATQAQTQATQDAILEQRRQFDLTRADQAPFRNTGVAANQRLAGLLGLDVPGANGQMQPRGSDFGSLLKRFGLSDLEADPVYQTGLKFGLDTGTNAINQRAIASGGYNSGAALKALTRFGNDYATQRANESYNRFNQDQTNIYNRLAGVSGSGQTATNQVQSAGMNATNNITDLTTQAGNARAAGVVGGANAWGNALTGAANSMQNNAILDALLNRRPY